MIYGHAVSTACSSFNCAELRVRCAAPAMEERRMTAPAIEFLKREKSLPAAAMGMEVPPL